MGFIKVAVCSTIAIEHVDAADAVRSRLPGHGSGRGAGNWPTCPRPGHSAGQVEESWGGMGLQKKKYQIIMILLI